MRIDHLEEMRHQKRRYQGDCCPCVTLVFRWLATVARCAPGFAILGCLVVASGASLIIDSRQAIYQLASDLGYAADAPSIVSQVSMLVIWTSGLAAFCLLAALPATGPVREYVFGRKGRGCTLFFQVIAGPLCLGLLAFASFVGFIFYLAVSILAVPTLTVLVVTWGACRSQSEQVRSGFAEALIEIARGKFGSIGLVANPSVEAVCQQDDQDAMLSGATSIVLGLLLLCIGQVCLTCVNANNLAKVQMTGEGDAKEV